MRARDVLILALGLLLLGLWLIFGGGFGCRLAAYV